MKFIYILLILNATCFAQTYEVKYYENSKILNQNNYNALPKNFQISYSPNVFSYKLVTDGKSSLYQNEKFNIKIAEQTIKTTDVDESGKIFKKEIFSEGFDLKTKERIFFKDFVNNTSSHQRYFDEYLKIVDSITALKWEILDESKEILGYSCKKAKTQNYGTDIYAWFTDEIPISDGPSLYNGLPGLILKIENKYVEIIAYDLVKNSNASPILPPEIKGEIYNYKTLQEYVNQKNQN
jgi:GLPGLI family protein